MLCGSTETPIFYKVMTCGAPVGLAFKLRYAIPVISAPSLEDEVMRWLPNYQKEPTCSAIQDPPPPPFAYPRHVTNQICPMCQDSLATVQITNQSALIMALLQSFISQDCSMERCHARYTKNAGPTTTLIAINRMGVTFLLRIDTIARACAATSDE